jgi:hypothetical protein
VGSLPVPLVDALKRELGLEQAIETGTHTGGTAVLLAARFASVTSIELSAELHAAAQASLASVPNLTLLAGSSPVVRRALKRPSGGALFWLDAHWSGHDTAGIDDPCPAVEEIRAIGAGHADDCLLIDDARLFNSADWPLLIDVMTTLKALRPEHHVTVVHDLIVAVPQRARPIIDDFAKRGEWAAVRAAEEARLGSGRARLNRVLAHPALARAVGRLVRLRRRLSRAPASARG